MEAELKAWRATVRDFVEAEIPREYIRETDAKHKPPLEAWEKIAAQGWLGFMAPEEYGGLGTDIRPAAILLEEVGRRSNDLAVMLFRTILHCNMRLSWDGTAEQREFYIPRAIRGEINFALGISEPDTGNDVASLTTRASRAESGWVINGHKMWTTGFQLSDYCIVLARTSPTSESRHRGLTSFIVDSKSSGITHREIPTLGRWPVPTGEVWFDDVAVTDSSVIGAVDDGWAGIMRHLAAERFCSASIWLGEATAAFEDSLEYAKARTQFGNPIGNYQAIAHKLANMHIQIEAARALMDTVQDSIEAGHPDRSQVAAMKVFVADTFKGVALDAMQICGGFGYSMEMDVQRYVRDSLLAPIGPGSNEVMRNVIAKGMGLSPN
jgi:acyl-CoA dehydrogenase